MKKLFLFALSVSLVSMTLNSCKKSSDDDDSTTPAASSSTIVGTWKTTAITVDPPINFFGQQISDLFNSIFYQDCNKDDLFVFKSDKTYEFNEGATKCDPDDDQIQDKGTWELNADKTVLTTVDDSGYVEMTTIKSLTSSQIVVEFTETDSATAITSTITQTMKKQ